MEAADAGTHLAQTREIRGANRRIFFERRDLASPCAQRLGQLTTRSPCGNASWRSDQLTIAVSGYRRLLTLTPIVPVTLALWAMTSLIPSSMPLQDCSCNDVGHSTSASRVLPRRNAALAQTGKRIEPKQRQRWAKYGRNARTSSGSGQVDYDFGRPGAPPIAAEQRHQGHGQVRCLAGLRRDSETNSHRVRQGQRRARPLLNTNPQ